MVLNSDERNLAHQLELSQRDLEELDCEKVIVAYEAVIEIEPKCEEA